MLNLQFILNKSILIHIIYHIIAHIRFFSGIVSGNLTHFLLRLLLQGKFSVVYQKEYAKSVSSMHGFASKLVTRGMILARLQLILNTISCYH